MHRRVRSAAAFMLVLTGAAGFVAGCPRESATAKLDVSSRKVVARVAGTPIYEGDVNRRILAAYGPVDRATLPEARWQMMQEAAVDSEILDLLLLRAARAEGMAVPEAVLEALVQKSRQQLGEEQFVKMLKERKATLQDFRVFLEERELIEQYRQKLFAGITLDGKTVRDYYQGHRKDFLVPESARLEVIVTLKRDRAGEIYDAWTKGESFDSLSRMAGSLDGQPAARRLRFTPYDAMPPEIGTRVKAAAPGEILPPIESGTRFHVVRVVEKRPGRPMTFEEAQEDVRRVLLAKKQQDTLERWLEGQRRSTVIEYER